MSHLSDFFGFQVFEDLNVKVFGLTDKIDDFQALLSEICDFVHVVLYKVIRQFDK